MEIGKTEGPGNNIAGQPDVRATPLPLTLGAQLPVMGITFFGPDEGTPFYRNYNGIAL